MRHNPHATFVRGLAGLAVVVIALLPAAAYFSVEYVSSVERLAHDARVQARVVSKVVTDNPQGWRDSADRFAAGIAEVRNAQSHTTVTDRSGEQLVAVGKSEGSFRLYRKSPFYDFGVEAGDVVVSSSLQRVAMVSALLAVAGLLFSLALLKLLREKAFARIDLAESRLRQSNAELRIAATAFEAAESMIITDASSKILRANRAFCESTGYTAEEVIGQTPRLLNSGRQDANFFANIWQSIKRTGSWQGEILDQRKNGDIYPVLLTITAVRGEDGEVTHFVGTQTDIAERKAAELALKNINAELEKRVEQRTLLLIAAKEEAEAANRAKSEFLGSMSHELRTPLNAVLGFSQLIGMDPKLDVATKDQVREIEQAGLHLLALVNDVIDLARIESGKLEVVPEPVQVQSVVAESLSMVAPIAQKYRIKLLDASADDCSGLTVRVDFVRLRQVLINLLSNAIKYNRPEGAVRLTCRLDGAAVRISVTDNGPGIPVEKQARLFTAFDRLGAECSTVEGTGIGLVITKRLVESMDGAIGFESVEGQGSTFWIEFPVARPE